MIELKRDAMADVVLNQLYRYTPLQTSFGVNTLALNGGRPRLMSLKELLDAFIRFRDEVMTRRTNYELRKARERAHVLVGLAIAVANIDEVIELIRRAPDPVAARERLMARDWPAGDVAPLIALIAEPGREVSAEGNYRLSEAQARAILDLRLQRLTGLERDKIAEELGEVAQLIEGYLELLGDRDKLFALMRDELLEIKEQFATPRRTEIDDNEFEEDIEDLIQREDMVVTVTHGGYIKRVPVSTYRAQRRGGKGRSGMATREDDFVSTPVRRQHPHAGAVLLQPRHRLQAQGLAPAARARRRRAARPSSTCCRSAKARRSSPSCRCPRTRRAGRRSM